MSEPFRYLSEMGCRKREQKYILDGFNSEFYLIFDADEGGKPGTVDVLIGRPGSSPKCDHVRLRADCEKHHVLRILAAIGIQQFDDRVKRVYYQLANPLRSS